MAKSGKRPSRAHTITCVYFGDERKKKVAADASRLGFKSVSAYISALTDLELSEAATAKLREMASAPAELTRVISSPFD